MKRNNLLNHFAVPALCALLLVCTGCETEQESSCTPDPNPPTTVFLNVDKGAVTVTNAEGKTLRYSGGAFSGSMAVKEQQSAASGKAGSKGRYYVEVAGSESFSCQWEEAGSYLFGLMPHYSLDGSHPDGGELYTEYTVSGDCLERVSITAEGRIDAVSEKNGLLTAAFSFPCDALGAHGYVRFSGVVGGNVSIWPNGPQNQFSFSGLLPGDCVLSYTGAVSSPWITVALEAGSGTLDFSRVAEGQIILQEDGREARILGKTE